MGRMRHLSLASYPDEYEIVTPSVSILAQPSVAVVDDNVKVNKTEELASLIFIIPVFKAGTKNSRRLDTDQQMKRY